jgi:hypothetical protein
MAQAFAQQEKGFETAQVILDLFSDVFLIRVAHDLKSSLSFCLSSLRMLFPIMAERTLPIQAS